MDKESTEWANQQLKKIVAKVKCEIVRLGDGIPYIPTNGKYTDVSKERGIDWWTNGFWSGLLWQLYHFTRDESFSEHAIKQEKRLDEAIYQFKDVHHDVGFMWLHTAVAHYRELNDEQALHTGLHAATLLAGRYNIAGNYIVAWNDHKSGWVIIDSMMNIPLLYWASQITDDPRFNMIAQHHADTVIKYLVGDDGSVGHIASFDPNTGEFIAKVQGQGYSASSAWSRGNSWAIYGFALSYRYSKNQKYLQIAKRVANNFIKSIINTDFIPKVDFLAPTEPEIYDTSAGLCAACGMLEISKWVKPEEREYYQQVAIKIIRSTEAKYANWNMDEDGIIGGGTEAYHRPATYDVPLIYSDYFFTEALLKITNQELFIW